MLGNDLVYLPNWPKRTGHRLERYRKKVFLPQEISQIQNSTDPYFYEALLWSAKEAAYKAWLKLPNSKPLFNPKHFKVSLKAMVNQLNQFEFRVNTQTCNTAPFSGFIKVQENYIKSYCTAKNLKGMLQIKSQTFKERPTHLWFENENWELSKLDFNIPVATYNGRQLALSLSHDNGLFWYVWHKE